MALSITPRAENLKLPLALHESQVIADATDSAGNRFRIAAGLSKELVEDLKRKSLDESDVELKRTSDYERFGVLSYENWYGSKERTLFALVHEKTGALAALVWFGPKPLGRRSLKHLSAEERSQDERLMDTDGWHTLVYRSYPPFRGTGIMKDFVRFTLGTYDRSYPEAKLWASVSGDNPASVGLAKALGFQEHTRNKDEIILVRE